MRLSLIAVGRLKPGPLDALAQHYAERIQWPLSVREVEEKRKLPAQEMIEREGALLLAALPPSAVLVALDERGRHMTSAAFAERVGRWRDAGTSDLAFVIGGAGGCSSSSIARNKSSPATPITARKAARLFTPRNQISVAGLCLVMSDDPTWRGGAADTHGNRDLAALYLRLTEGEATLRSGVPL